MDKSGTANEKVMPLSMAYHSMKQPQLQNKESFEAFTQDDSF